MKFSLKKRLLILAIIVMQLQSSFSCNPVDEEITDHSARRLSWRELGVAFVVSAVVPFPNETDPNYKQVWQQIRDNGISSYAWNYFRTGAQDTWQKIRQGSVKGCFCGVYQGCKDYPLDAATSAALVLSGAGIQYAPHVVATVNGLKQGRSLMILGRSIDGSSIINKGAKLFIIGVGVYAIGNAPAAAALDVTGMKTYGELKDYFSGGPCSSHEINDQMDPIVSCLNAGKGMQECRALDTTQVPNDFRVFTVHPTSDASLNPVSTVKFGPAKEVCFLTALKPGEPVTETCFVDLSNPSNHTVQVLPSVTLADAHKGLQPGQSMQYFSMKAVDRSCASFIPIQAKYELGGEPVCMLLKSPGAEGQQMCFNPANPSDITLRVAPVDLSPMIKDDKPYALVVRDPDQYGLVIRPDAEPQPVCFLAEERIHKFMELHKLRAQLASLEQDLGISMSALPAERSCQMKETEVASLGSYKLVRSDPDPDCVAAMNAQDEL